MEKDKYTEDLTHLNTLISKIEVAMLTTRDQDGRLHSRPMVTQNATFDGYLWFLTEKDTEKMDEIRKSPRVNVTFADPINHNYVSVSGWAEPIENRAKVLDLWHEAYRLYFPDGPESDLLVLLRVNVESAEYWKTKRLKAAYNMAKAYLQNEPYQGEGVEHGKVLVSS